MKFIGVLLLTLLIVGCSFCPEPETETIYISPEDHWIVPCKKEAPPSMERYNAADDVGKIYLFSAAYNEQTANIERCNKQLEGIRVWKEKHVKDSVEK